MNRERGSSLIGVLAAVVIVIVLVLVFAFGGFGTMGKDGTVQGNLPPRADGKGQTIPGRALVKARDVECRGNLANLRQAIEIATDPVENTRPDSLNATRLSKDMQRCPVGEEPYTYDPATGVVKCPHPGHEKF